MPDMRKFTAFLLLFSIGLLMLVLQGAPAFAQTGTPDPTDDEINAIARKLYCPVCENIPLDVCSTQACAQWRDLIREKIALGWTQDQIIAYFAEQYGDRVLANPPVRNALSLNILASIVPPLAFVIGVFIVIRYLSKRKVIQQTDVIVPATATSPEDDAYLARIEDEIRRNP